MSIPPSFMPHYLDDAPFLPKDKTDGTTGDTNYEETDGARNKDAIDSLTKLFLRFGEGANTGKSDEMHIRIGLFGGFGQGKTSVWQAAERKVNATNKHKWGKKWCKSFDAAQHKADALEHEFDRLLAATQPVLRTIGIASLPWIFRLFALLIATSLLSIILASNFPISPPSTKTNPSNLLQNSWLMFMPAAWLILIPAIQLCMWLAGKVFGVLKDGVGPHWLRLQEREAFFQQQHVDIYFWRGPRWLVIDNLDRASDAQQRAILRSIYKNKDALHFSILVCMDETRLLQSDPAPESPLELLTKAIQLEIRLPGRVPLDACRLAWQMTVAASPPEASEKSWQTLMHHPKVIAGLARALVLANFITPRFTKRLLNDTNHLHWHLAQQRAKNNYTEKSRNVQAERETPLPHSGSDFSQPADSFFAMAELAYEISSVEDWLAALRVITLTLILPAVRHDNHRFAQVLLSNDEMVFDRFAREMQGEMPANEAQLNKAVWVFGASRHWRPHHGEWLPYVAATQLPRGQHKGMKSSIPPTQLLANTPPDFRIFDHFWRCLNFLGDGYGTELFDNLSEDLTNITRKIEMENKTLAQYKADALTGKNKGHWELLSPDEQQRMMQTLMLSADIYCLLAESAPKALRAISLLAPWENKPEQAPVWQAYVDGKLAKELLWLALATRADLANCISCKVLRHWLTACHDADLRFAIASLMPASLLGQEDRLAIAAESTRQQLDEAVASFCQVEAAACAPTPVWHWLRDAEVDKHMGRYWPPLAHDDPEIFRKLAEQLDLWRKRFAGKAQNKKLPNSLQHLLFQDDLFYRRLRHNPADRANFINTLWHIFELPNAPLARWQLGFWRNIVDDKNKLDGVVDRALMKRTALLMRHKRDQHLVPHAEHRTLIRFLLIASNRRIDWLCKRANRFPPPPPEIGRVLKSFVETCTWAEQLDDATWTKLFANCMEPNDLFQRKPILPINGSIDTVYEQQLALIKELAQKRPSLIASTIGILVIAAKSDNRSQSIQQRYLRDGLDLRGMLADSYPLSADIEQTLTELANAGRANTASFEEFIQQPQFEDIYTYKEWLENGVDAFVLGLADITDAAARATEVNRRIALCFALAPEDITEDRLNDYRSFLWTAANKL